MVSRGSAFGNCKTSRSPSCAVRSQRKSAQWMWNYRSKLKLDGQCRFHARTERSARFVSPCYNGGLWPIHGRVKTRTPGSRVGLRALLLFQFALGFFRKVQMLLNHFCCIIRKLLHVGIAPTACFLFEFSQVLFVILDHHVHVGLV